MNLKFSWLNSRKSLICSTFFDFSLFSILFIERFNKPISNESILALLALINIFIWITSSYIIGRYANFRGKLFNIFFDQIIKTFLIIIINLFISQILFKLFWSWEYMNFYSFSNFLDSLLSFYKLLFFSSGLSQFLINLYLSRQFIKKSISSLWIPVLL